MDTLVVRITPRRIERAILLAVIIFFVITTINYANKYYDTTPEDEGYLDQLFSGTFVADVPTDAEIIAAVENSTDGNPQEVLTPAVDSAADEDVLNSSSAETEMNETESADEPEPECNWNSDCSNGERCVNQTCVDSPKDCDKDDFKLVSFATTDDETAGKEGTIENAKVQMCNLDDDEQYVIAEIHIWDEWDLDNNNDDTEKRRPKKTLEVDLKELEPGELYVQTYEFEFPISVLDDPKFYYEINFYYADVDGEKVDNDPVEEVSGSYTI